MKCEITREEKENRVGKIAGKGRECLILLVLMILAANLTACKSEGSSDASEAIEETVDTAENAASGKADETVAPSEPSNGEVSAPETYEDYMKLAAESYDKQDWETALAYYQGAKEKDESRQEAYRGISDTYLQMDDVMQALAILDEGMEKCSIDLMSQNTFSQRKEYILAATVAVRTKFAVNEYDDEGAILSSRVSECNENGNEISYKAVFYNAGGEISNAAEYRYDGKGNQIEYQYVSYDSDGNTSEFWHKTWVYDTVGNEIEYTEYDENGNRQEKKVYEYDTNGNQVKETNYDKDDKIIRWVETEYDTAGNEIKWECYYEYGRHTTKRIYTRDESGKLIKYVEYKEGSIREKKEYERDERGNVIKSVFYDGDGNITKIWEYEYDKNDREIKHVLYETDGTVEYWCEYEYDEKGREIRFKSYNSTGNFEYRMSENEYDESGRRIYHSYEENGVVTQTWKNEYDEDGDIIKETDTYYDSDTGQKTNETVCEYTYDEKKNRTEYVRIYYDEGREVTNLRWKREYDEEGRGTDFYFYDNEQAVSYRGRTEYDENGLITKYTGYDKNGEALIRRETEYDTSGKVIKENYYDADGNLIWYYENEYDDFGSVTRQAMYEEDALRAEKQMSYVYHYIGNIDAEAADYMDNDITPEEYNRKQREIFTRFLGGQEKVRYYRNVDNIEEGKIVEEAITDLTIAEYDGQYKNTLKYTFLDMTGDGIEELLICYGEKNEKLCVIQCIYGILKVIYDMERSSLIKYNGRMGVCCDYGVQNGEGRVYYYFLDEKGKKKIFLSEYQDWTESIIYYMSNNDSFEECDIVKGEYYDIMSMMTEIEIDWQELEEPAR